MFTYNQYFKKLDRSQVTVLIFDQLFFRSLDSLEICPASRIPGHKPFHQTCFKKNNNSTNITGTISVLITYLTLMINIRSSKNFLKRLVLRFFVEWVTFCSYIILLVLSLKLAVNEPWTWRCAIHWASCTSVFLPGTFFCVEHSL